MTDTKQIRDDFKLLAIRPNKGCSAEYYKILEEGQLYSFYNDYEFVYEDSKDKLKSEINQIKSNPTILSSLYDQGNLKVNISALVGKNGSGKSTLIELLFYGIYCIGTSLKDEYKRPLLPNSKEKIEQEKIDFLKEIEALKTQLGKSGKENKKLQCEIISIENSIEELDEMLQTEEEKHLAVCENLKVSFYFQSGESFFEYKYDKEVRVYDLTSQRVEMKFANEDPNSPETYQQLLQNFPFSIAINYSHHSLNNLTLGNWINSLFHKNDGYKAPVSINPMRTYGNFDINQEVKFAMNRLLFNMLLAYRKDSENKFSLGENFVVGKIKLGLNTKKVKNIDVSYINGDIKGRGKGSEISNVQRILKSELDVDLESYLKKDTFFGGEILKYLAKKYRNLRRIISDNENQNIDETDFEDKVIGDQTHLTFKFWQTINYIKNFDHSPYKNLLEGELSNGSFELTLEDLNSIIPEELGDDAELINYMPPPIFDIDIIPQFSQLKSKDDQSSNPVSFKSLSSGEQQLIHTIQAVMYHINNLQSVHKDENRMAYKYVNILLDEIELYFHPEYQRQMVKRLLHSLNLLNMANTDKGIKAVNILFSTHSPFILSDIPSCNTLRLEGGVPKSDTSKTFGANIHDLLANDFFMDDGFMGEFAKGEILSAINFLQSTIKKETPGENSRWNKISLDRFIQLIGEPMLRNSLNGLYEEAYLQNVDQIDEQILRLQKLREQQAKQQRPDDSDTN